MPATPSSSSRSGATPARPGPVAATPAAGPASGEVAGGLRFRLRQKTAVPPPPAEADASSESPGGALGEWPNFWEDPADNRERCRYDALRHRVKCWLKDRIKTATPEELESPDLQVSMRMLAGWRSVSHRERGQVIGRFLTASTPPPKVAAWARALYVEQADCDDEKGSAFLWSQAVMLTYNGPWGVMGSTAVPADATLAEVVAMLSAEPAAAEIWQKFLDFIQRLCERWPGLDWAAAQELCTQSWTRRGEIRWHLHLHLKRGAKMWCPKQAGLAFQGSLPVKSNREIMGSQKRAPNSYSGFYYLRAPKVGGIRSASSKEPFSGFPVRGVWVMNLIQGGKISLPDARAEVLKTGESVCRRLADVDRLIAADRELRLRARMAEVQSALRSTQRRSATVAAVDAWLVRCRSDPAAARPSGALRRKPFLVLCGPSGFGKTEFLRNIFGPARTVELNCASCKTAPDMRQHDGLLHRLVILDEASAELCLAN